MIDVFEYHRVCDADHVELALKADVVCEVEASQDRPDETLVVGVLHVDNRLPPDQLLRGSDVCGAV